MDTYIAYFDETGDDGTKPSSSDLFVLTSFCFPTESWQKNFDTMKMCRKCLKDTYGFHSAQEMHTKHFIMDKSPYREYSWDNETRRKILLFFAAYITKLDGNAINVIIDKANIKRDDYKVLENALKYNIQRIENTSNGNWNYIIVSDKGRVKPMRKTARAMRVYNPIQSQFSISQYQNKPLNLMVEDIFEKESHESYFIQVCDFISYFVHLYYEYVVKHKDLPKRVSRVIDKGFIVILMNYFKEKGVLNLKASSSNKYGLVIYPKK